jgi:hypothetical protein
MGSTLLCSRWVAGMLVAGVSWYVLHPSDWCASQCAFGTPVAR